MTRRGFCLSIHTKGECPRTDIPLKSSCQASFKKLAAGGPRRSHEEVRADVGIGPYVVEAKSAHCVFALRDKNFLSLPCFSSSRRSRLRRVGYDGYDSATMSTRSMLSMPRRMRRQSSMALVVSREVRQTMERSTALRRICTPSLAGLRPLEAVEIT